MIYNIHSGEFPMGCQTEIRLQDLHAAGAGPVQTYNGYSFENTAFLHLFAVNCGSARCGHDAKKAKKF